MRGRPADRAVIQLWARGTLHCGRGYIHNFSNGCSNMNHLQMTIAPPSASRLLAPCPVQPLDRVTFTPHEPSDLNPVVAGTVCQVLDTHSGNWRVRVVKRGEDFPHGPSVNVYTNLGSFEVHSTLNPDLPRAVA